jgi:O-acetyl-ADP-ribose deacetylase (regulator of RNase III)
MTEHAQQTNFYDVQQIIKFYNYTTTLYYYSVIYILQVGAIVNTTSTDLKLDKGAVSATLLKKGGPILQQECSQKYPKGVRYGEVAVTSGGQLQCQIVCHGSLDQWRKDGSSIKVLERTHDT